MADKTVNEMFEAIKSSLKLMRDHADEMYKLVPPDEGKRYNSMAAWHGHEINKYAFRINYNLGLLEKTLK